MKWFDDEIEKEFNQMRQRMGKMLGALPRPGTATLCSDAGWRPSVDLYETSDGFTVLVEVAGIQPDEVIVVVEREVVRISGNRCRPPDQNVTRVHHMEIDFGSFSHLIRLPAPVDADAASSSYRGGFLTIRLPKLTSGSRSITVTTGE
jgi:HSP20 family protein